MVNKSVFRWLQILAAFTAILTICTLIIMNVQYNLTGYDYMPYSLSSTFENIKDSYYGTAGIGQTTSKRIENRLVGFSQGIRTIPNKDADLKSPNYNTTKDILWFNKPPWMNISQQNKFLRNNCTYLNCQMSTNKTNLQKYSAIIYALTENAIYLPPISRRDRNPDQMWIFFYSESPINQGRLELRHKNWRNTMNWSMSYNMDADIFRPYGYLIQNTKIINSNYSAIFHRKTKQVAWAVSHCDAPSRRDEYVAELVRHGIQVDIFGKCGNMPYHDGTKLKQLISGQYKFFLSFENSFCKDYFTEKFINYYNLDVILIVRGGLDYDKYLPNNTFINTAHFSSAKHLADYIVNVASTEHVYTGYLQRKSRYTARHVYEMPQTPCMLCEKLNKLNENRKTYTDHVTYVHDRKCWSPNDVTKPDIDWLKIMLMLVMVFCLSLLLWKCKSLKFFHKNYIDTLYKCFR